MWLLCICCSILCEVTSELPVARLGKQFLRIRSGNCVHHNMAMLPVYTALSLAIHVVWSLSVPVFRNFISESVSFRLSYRYIIVAHRFQGTNLTVLELDAVCCVSVGRPGSACLRNTSVGHVCTVHPSCTSVEQDTYAVVSLVTCDVLLEDRF